MAKQDCLNKADTKPDGPDWNQKCMHIENGIETQMNGKKES